MWACGYLKLRRVFLHDWGRLRVVWDCKYLKHYLPDHMHFDNLRVVWDCKYLKPVTDVKSQMTTGRIFQRISSIPKWFGVWFIRPMPLKDSTVSSERSPNPKRFFLLMTVFWKCCIRPWWISRKNGPDTDRIGGRFIRSWKYFSKNDYLDYKLFLAWRGWLGQPCLTCPETAL